MAIVVERGAAWSRVHPIDYSDWEEFDSAETITSAVITGGVGLTFAIVSFGGSVVNVRITGGTPGTRYEFRCAVTTSQGNTFNPRLYVQVTGD